MFILRMLIRLLLGRADSDSAERLRETRERHASNVDLIQYSRIRDLR